jgi:hypothetical protein
MNFPHRSILVGCVGLGLGWGALQAEQTPNPTPQQIQKATDVLHKTEAPAAPAVPPAPAASAAHPESASKEQRLSELLQRYKDGQIRPAEYHKERARILGKPFGFGLTDSAASPPATASAKAAATDSAKPLQAKTTTGDKVSPSPKVAPVAGLVSQARQEAQTMVDQATAGALEAAIVPGADFILRLDLKSARRAPIYNTLKALQDEKPNAELPLSSLNDVSKKLEAKLGLKEEDVDSLLLSADLDGVKLSPLGPDPDAMKSIQGILAVQVGKKITSAQLKDAIQILSAEGDQPGEVKMTEEKIGSADLIVVTPKSETDPKVHLALLGGRTILVGLNRESVSQALARTGVGQQAKLDGAMANVMKSIGPSSQVKLSFVVPKALKDMLGAMTQPPEQPGADPAGAAPPPDPISGAMAGFKDIRSISLGVTLAEGLVLNLSGDLGNAEAANGINMLLAMMKPQFKASLAEQTGKKPEQIADNALTSAVRGNVINVALSLGKDVLLALGSAKK